MRNSSRPSASAILLAATITLASPVTSVLAGPVASFSRGSVDFGRIPSNFPSSPQPVFVTNTGDAPLTISGTSIVGANAADFSVAGTCTPPTIVPANSRCRLEFRMLASGESKRFGTFTLQSDSSPPPSDIALTGMMDNLGPYLPPKPAPGWVDFSAQPVGTAASPQIMTLANGGDISFHIDGIDLLGGNPGDFSLSSTCLPGGTFANGTNCAATIGFAPTASGPRSTELRFALSVGSIKGAYYFSVTGIGGTGGPAPTVTVVEFYNMGLDHYFITYGTQEISDLDTGVHKGWARTGYAFNAYTSGQAGTSPVCRFYIPPALGDSHFFGRGTAECDATGQKNPSFELEDPAFMQMLLPVAGVCPVNTTEVYRVFSNRADANHRYMTDKAVRDAMVAKGWLAEGDGPNLVVMCAPA